MKDKSSTLRIHVSNISEDVWGFIKTISDKKSRQFEIDENAEFSDRDVFSLAGEENVVLVLPRPLDPDFFAYFLEVFPKKNFRVLVPRNHTGELCTDMCHDVKLFYSIVEEMKKYTSVVLTSYSASQQFYVMLEKLREFHTQISTPESPNYEDRWTVNFFGSKTGIRQLADHHATPDFPTVQGYSMSSVELASQMAAHMYRKEGAVVIKTNKGHAGVGVEIIRPGELDEKKAEQQIKKRLSEDAYWEKFPILVEQYVDCDLSIAGGFPNAEFRVSEGKVEFLFDCGMRVTRAGTFRGVEIGEECMPKKVRTKVVEAGYAIGKGLSQYGYNGYYDVDCLAAKDGTIYVSESNVRRTGGTHVYASMKALFGKNFSQKVYSFCNNSYEIKGKEKWTFKKLRSVLEPILYSPKQKQGVLITEANPLYRNVFGYIIVGPNRKEAYQIEEKMEEILQSHTDGKIKASILHRARKE